MQLLEHYKDIFEAMMKGCRTGIVYLDFAKTFDKVDHNILMRKCRAHEICGKVGREICPTLPLITQQTLFLLQNTK